MSCRTAFALVLLCFAAACEAAEPRVFDDSLKLSLFAEAPDIVTPIGVAVDKDGQLFVIESHTHHRRDDYKGPATDRIRILSDSDGDGRADKFETFYEGMTHTMGMTFAPEGSLYVATRAELFRLQDTNNDGKADAKATIARLETKGDYPHNGLAGPLFDGKGSLFFGFGENLGFPYKLVGSDGTTLEGEGEGGTFYRCKEDGSKLELYATGFWNPFSSCFDSHGRLFTVDNDPDGMPPCRLLQVVPGADYGYQFRYGRSGRHPLQAWNGELPGTLPMAAGVGEAPSGILPFQGKLWVTSWGDHRIERHTVKPFGASAQTKNEIVIQGDSNFRPVGFALDAANKKGHSTIYVSDWVDRSYPVHGKGRIWRIHCSDVKYEDFTPLTADEKLAAIQRMKPTVEALAHPDAYVRQAAAYGFTKTADAPKWSTVKPGLARAELLQAIRFASPESHDPLKIAMADKSEAVKIVAMRWAADLNLAGYQNAIQTLAQQSSVSPQMFKVAIATSAWLESGKVEGGRTPQEELLVKILNDENSSPETIASALSLLPPDHKALSVDNLVRWTELKKTPRRLRAEAIRTLSMRSDEHSQKMLSNLALIDIGDEQLRADIIAGISTRDAQFRHRLYQQMQFDGLSGAVKTEAERSLARRPEIVREIEVGSIDEWMQRVGKGGNKHAGRRVFFNAARAACAKCHQHQGRGAKIGPDLTGIGKQSDRRKLLESILMPSKEIGPEYTPWILETTDGRQLTGLSMPKPYNGNEEDGKEFYVDSQGQPFEVQTAQIEARRQLSRSIMPDGIHKLIDDDELRDLLAFLED